MTVSLWEWAVTRDEQGGSAGVSMTRHGAMQALTMALVRAGRPRSGHVVPVLLARPVNCSPYYLRGPLAETAVFDGEAVRWR
jgi:hypothetical protein